MEEHKATNITVTVDTANISDKHVEKFVTFTDDRGNSSGKPGNAKEFSSKVDKNKRVYWRGKALKEDAKDVVEILAVQRKPKEGGAEILLRTRKEDGMVIGKVKDKDIQGEELYDLSFRINEEEKTYTVDPKLRMT
jgi:hypothetical protein